MRVQCQRKEMADLTHHFDLNHSREKKLELVKMLLDSIKADKCKQKIKKGGHHHHHGMSGFGRFWKHGHGGPGHHGHHHFKHKRHGHHHDFFRRSEHHHGWYGRHRLNCHDKQRHPEEINAMLLIDLTEDDQDNVNDSVSESPNQIASTSNEQNNESVTNTNCKCTRFPRRHCGRRGRSINELYKMISNESTAKDNATQTDKPMDGDDEVERENITTMVENITIENFE